MKRLVQHAASSRRGLVFLASLVVLALLVPASAAEASHHVTLTFEGSGTLSMENTYPSRGEEEENECSTNDTVELNWKTEYTGTVENGALKLASGLLKEGIGSMNLSGKCTPKEPEGGIACSGELDAPDKGIAIEPGSTGGGISVRAISTDAFVGAPESCAGKAGASFAERDLSAFEPEGIGGATLAVIHPMPREIQEGFTKSVSSGEGNSASVSCLVDGYMPEGDQCSASFSWSGTITLTAACQKGSEWGTVTYSKGPAPAVGTTICEGETISVGAGGRAEIELQDGSKVRLGPETTLEEVGHNETSQEQNDTWRQKLGAVWAETTKAVQGVEHEFGIEVPAEEQQWNAVGVRGSGFTLSVKHDKPTEFHVIKGAGYYRPPGGTKESVPAGYTATFGDGKKETLTTAWNPSPELVPASSLPPKITRAKLLGAGRHAGAKLSFTLSEAATITATVKKGSRAVRTVHASGKHGANTIKLLRRPIRRGTYTVLVKAENAGRVSIEQLKLRVR
ncbi:MAG TPA: FecR family protein [Solirubrobacteraceae bacterium]|nr:FecR family protein [Solirubrobacteraceae bacterium]